MNRVRRPEVLETAKYVEMPLGRVGEPAERRVHLASRAVRTPQLMVAKEVLPPQQCIRDRSPSTGPFVGKEGIEDRDRGVKRTMS